MKIYDNLKEMSLIQCLITLQTWYCRLNKQWNRLVRDNGAKFDWLRVPAVIFAIATLFLAAYVPAEALAVGSAESHNIWVAYTVGDVSFTHSVLRAISMMMYGGGGVIQGAYRLAALLGIIWLIVRGIFSKDGLNLGSGLFVILFYMCFFVPQSTLHIEDMQTKKYYTMDKIPLGVSASLSVVSKIGKYLSESYETVFVDVASDNGLCTTGAMECNGYLGTLDLLVKARSSLQNSAAYLAINQSLCHSNTDYSNCDIETSLVNYVRDCTIHKVTNPNERFSLKNVKAFTNNADTSSEMRYHSERHLVNVYLGKGKTGTKTCKDAGTYIEQAFNDAKVKSTIFKLASPAHNMNPHDGGVVTDGGTGFDNGTTTGRENTAALQGMMDEALTGLGGSTADSYEYLRNVIMQPLIEEGMKAGYVDQNMMAARITLETAIAQRDLQLAAESSMFATMVRPLSTFLEGFVLALTPIMPFIILISVNGFAICMKYLMVLLWIQLWAPALSICNMYVQNVTRENLAIALVGTDITSLAGISRATPIIQHWLAVGGMMGASVPVLTLFILSGSIYTFNSLATSMKGSDHFDEKAIQPDAIKKAAYINDSVGSFNANSGAGVIKDGTQPLFKMYSWQDLNQKSEQSAHTESIETGRQFVHSFGEAWNSSKTGQMSMGTVENFGHALQVGKNFNYEKGRSVVNNWAQSHGTKMEDSDIDTIMAAAMLKGGTKIKQLADIGGELKGGRSFSAILGTDFNTKLDDIYNELQGTKETTLDSDAMAKTLSSLSQENLVKGLQQSETGNLINSYNKYQKANDTYQKAINRTKSSSSTRQVGSNNIATLLMRTKFNEINNWLKNNQDICGEIARNASAKGYDSNTTGIFSAAVEYALDNSDTNAKADELRKVMGLDNVHEGVENNLKDLGYKNPVDDIPDNSASVEGKLNTLSEEIAESNNELKDQYNATSQTTKKENGEGQGTVNNKGGTIKTDVTNHDHDMRYGGGVPVIGRGSGRVFADNVLAFEKARLIQALEGSSFKYGYDDITEIEILKNGNKIVYFPDGYSLELAKYDPHHKPQMDLIDYIPSMNLPGTTAYTPDGQDLKRGKIWFQGDSKKSYD